MDLFRARRRSRKAFASEPDDDALDAALSEPESGVLALLLAAVNPQSSSYARAFSTMDVWPARLWFKFDSARIGMWHIWGDDNLVVGDWATTIERPGVSTLLLVLASTHANGFLRERAVALLAERAEPLAAAAVAVRMADHVLEVRALAEQVLERRVSSEDAAVVAPILKRASRRSVAEGSFDRYVAHLDERSLIALARSHDIATRRFAIAKATLSSAELLDIATTDPDVPVRLAATKRMIEEEPQSAAVLIDNGSSAVRAAATLVGADDIVEPRLDQLLLDRHSRLRRVAQRRARQLKFDAATLYRDNLPSRTAVLGLGETGSASDVSLVLPVLGGNFAPSTRNAAVRALGRLEVPDKIPELMLPLIVSDERSIAREAGRQLRRVKFTLTGARLDEALVAPRSWTRAIALGLTYGRPGWDTPAAALALYDDDDEDLRKSARSALAMWLSRRSPTAGIPRPDQAERVRSRLSPAVPADVVRELRFAAGIRD